MLGWRFLPGILDPTFEEVRTLIASEERSHYMEGVDVPQITRSLIKPIREITDRGGKSWRSYAALACCDVVLGDSRKWVQWLAMPEFLHVGSLIVDDVQDKSTIRRGKPSCHLLYGEPIAINAGTAAYFMGQKMLTSNEISDAQKLRLYDFYFETMRAGHAGQALDLDGPGELMPQAVATGNSAALEARILATHRLKTGAPAGSLARMGALVGGGSEAQIDAVERFFESLGLAFQIVDDVLNLRGFKGNLKSAGEDITNGTITLPVAKAMSRLEQDDRAWLWRTVASKPQDRAVVGEVVQKLESCGAITATEQEARLLVEGAWERAEPLLRDSISKVMLRAFGWFVLERHY
jgi:geranylgeranyl pyrophosphate synthase